MSSLGDPLLVLAFGAAAAASLGASWVLVARLERIGARLRLSEALLGMLAALAADAPEVTAAVTALAGHQARIGTGVVIGSNVFNLAALLGLSALVAGRIALHRRVVVLEGAVALWIATVCVLAVTGLLSPAAGLAIVLAVLVPYLVALGARPDRLARAGLPDRWARWLAQAILEEERELEPAIHPRPGGARDGLIAALALGAVIAASIAMEQAAAAFGSRHRISQLVVGGLIVAIVTSLPNAVAAIYLARRGRGTATLSTAMNSNALNVAAGLLVPGTIAGLGAPTGGATFVALSYLAVTALALGCAWLWSGLGRREAVLIVGAYAAFVAALLGGV
ncbi:MAG: sodium:calcium antiporter [Solirubrobacteraceae bacterium]